VAFRCLPQTIDLLLTLIETERISDRIVQLRYTVVKA
jgi:hypothetical protein